MRSTAAPREAMEKRLGTFCARAVSVSDFVGIGSPHEPALRGNFPPLEGWLKAGVVSYDHPALRAPLQGRGMFFTACVQRNLPNRDFCRICTRFGLIFADCVKF